MIVTGSARCERPPELSRSPRPPQVPAGPVSLVSCPAVVRPHGVAGAAHPVPACSHLPYTRRLPWVQQSAIGSTHGEPGGWRTAAHSMWTTSRGMWMELWPEIFSAHRPWTASTQVAGVANADRYAASPRVSSACAQADRRVCTEFPQGYAHRDWTPGGGHHKTVVATYYN